MWHLENKTILFQINIPLTRLKPLKIMLCGLSTLPNLIYQLKLLHAHKFYPAISLASPCGEFFYLISWFFIYINLFFEYRIKIGVLASGIDHHQNGIFAHAENRYWTVLWAVLNRLFLKIKLVHGPWPSADTWWTPFYCEITWLMGVLNVTIIN